MKNNYKYLLVSLAAMICSWFGASALTVQLPHDTIYFYETWAQMMDMQPVAMIVDPFIDCQSNCEVYIESGVDSTNDLIKEKFIAFSRGDSTWFMNSEYLKKNFMGDTKGMKGFLPVFFNEKMAFVVSYGPLSVKDLLLGNTGEEGITDYNYDDFFIDFRNHSVNRVSHNYLSELLEDYPDLLMRYEGMKDYKNKDIIEDYFFKYIDRATDDIMRPYILDLVN